MQNELIELTRQLIQIPSVTRFSNGAISDFLEDRMRAAGFEIERLAYVDENGEQKINVIGRLGPGTGGLAFFSHSDTVPAQEDKWDAYGGTIEDGRLYGRGSCDMKGPIAAALLAATHFDQSQLTAPVFLAITADEEVGGYGAELVTKESKLLAAAQTPLGIVTEPTELIPVYSHKGVAQVEVTAHGVAAHTSTARGTSANFLIAPFLAEMAELATTLKEDKSYWNEEFEPPSNGFNMTLNDDSCAQNVTAAKTTCQLFFRAAPNDRTEEIVDHITNRAEAYGFDASTRFLPPFYTDPQSEFVRTACRVTGERRAQTVPYGTDALHLHHKFDCLILGAGDIKLAHTVGEYVPVDELTRSVGVYQQMIEAFCTAS